MTRVMTIPLFGASTLLSHQIRVLYVADPGWPPLSELINGWGGYSLEEGADGRLVKGDRRGEKSLPAQLGVAPGKVKVAGAAGLHAGDNLRIGTEQSAVDVNPGSPADQEIGFHRQWLGLADLGKEVAG